MTHEEAPSFDSTLTLVRQLFGNRVDLGGEPYWLHPVAVADLLPACATQEDRLIALLHDVLEDCRPAIAQRLGLSRSLMNLERAVLYLDGLGYSRYVVDGVCLLTHEDGFSYDEYIEHLVAARHSGALLTKRADLTHNMAPERLAKIKVEHSDRIMRKVRRCYEPAMLQIDRALYDLDIVPDASVTLN